MAILVVLRLFYWQVVVGQKLQALAESQYFDQREIPAERGQIFSSDGFPLATNQQAYLIYATIPQLRLDSHKITNQLIPILEPKEPQAVEKDLEQRLNRQDLVWVPLAHGVNQKAKEAIEGLKISGLGFEEEEKRFYPEGSMSAHLLGFVGQDSSGRSKGYFGIEGFYDRSLMGKPGFISQEKDASGKPILIGRTSFEGDVSGRDLQLYLDRREQFLVEEYLRDGVAAYKAKGGSVIVMEPKTGAVLAMASFPSYQPGNYAQEESKLFSNPAVSQTFEPGSIFKVLIMAAAINEGVVKPEDKCDKCNGSRQIGEYVIRTWDGKYYPNSTMTEILEHSDNVGMVSVAEKLGLKNLISYLKAFGIDKPTGVDLEGEVVAPFRKESDWGFIDLATASFGQGVAVTPIQMVRAVAAIANGGYLVEPHVVARIKTPEKEIEIKPKVDGRIISQTTAKVVTEMMVSAVERGGKWETPKNFRVAGKTGTAQIPIAGHYDETKTIVSFIGFAPADEPKFVMLVTLREPVLTWSGMTAAPLWFKIAERIMRLD